MQFSGRTKADPQPTPTHHPTSWGYSVYLVEVAEEELLIDGVPVADHAPPGRLQSRQLRLPLLIAQLRSLRVTRLKCQHAFTIGWFIITRF